MKHLKLFFALFAMLALGVGNAWAAGNYVKVTTAPSDWSGDYLIVYEDGEVAFNGALSADAAKNTISVTITDGKITSTTDIDKAKFTIAKSNTSYTIKAACGSYIGQTADGNKVLYSTSTKYTNSISLNNDGTAHIVASGKPVLRYNATSGQERFRYFKSTTYTSQKAIHLYKYIEEQSGGETPVASLSATPTTIDFGTVYQGTTVEDKTVAVSFENLTGSVTYSGLSTPFTATGAISATGDKITISADASTIGEHSQTLTIQSAADSKTAEVTVKMNVEVPFNGKKLGFDFVNHPTGWPVKSNATAGEYVYNLDDTDYTFKHSKSGDGVYVAGTSGTSGYLLIASGNTLGLPAIKGHKLVKVQGTLNNSGSPSTSASVSITDGTNTLSGGAAQTWNTKGGVYTYSLSGTQANTMYYLSVSNKNLQMITLVLYYEECEKYVLTITEPTDGTGTLVVKDGENVLTSGAEIYEGTKLTIIATPETGYEEGVVVVKNASDEDVTADVYEAGTLTMPAYAVTISATFEKKPCELLAKPTVSATTTYSSATLTWEAVVNAAKYSVKVGTADAVETTETSYEVTGLTAETTYTYQVQAIAEAEQDTYCDSEVAEGSFTTTAAPVATLTLSDIEGTTTQTGALNGTITLPTTAAECSKTFVGWDADENCNNAPTYAPGAEYTFTTVDPTLYAVYADGESGEAVAIFSETFDACNGTGGNDDKWSGSIASGTLTLTGWTCANGAAAKACAKFGSGSKKGSAETPAITLTGDATLTFRAAAWSGDSKTLNLSATGATLGEASVTLKDAEWTEYTIAITGATGSVKIKFEAKNASSNRFFLDDVVVSQTSVNYSNYSTTCAAAPIATVDPTSVTATAAGVNGTLEVSYENVNTEDLRVALFNDEECGVVFTAGWLTASIDADKNITYTVAENTTYAERKAYIQLTAPDAAAATDPAVVVIPVTQAAKEKVFASLAELLANITPTTDATKVTVTLTKEPIVDIYVSGTYRNGIYLNVPYQGSTKKIEIYSRNVPAEWVVGGSVSGTLENCDWKDYNGTWELCPADWSELTYQEPKAVSTVVVSGAPTKTVYVDGEAFDPAGLTVTVNYNDATSEENPTGVTFNVTPATLTKGETAVSVTATFNSVTSAAYEVTNLTVNDIPTKTVAEFIAAGGTRCYLEGIVSDIDNTTYGNFNLTDASGTIYVYGCLNAAGESKKFAELNVKNGDKIKVIADQFKVFGGKDQATDVQYVSHKSAATIEVADIAMEVGETHTISATVTPADASVTYAIKADRDNCITLNDTEITATAAGTATIVATIAETADYMGATKEITVTVTAPDTRKQAVSPSSFTAISGDLNPNDITFASYQGGAGTAPGIYNNGIRLYQISSGTYGGYITLTAVKGCMIDQVEITTTEEYQSTTVAYSVDDNETLLGSANVDKLSKYSTPVGLNTESVNILNLGTTKNNRLEIASITVYYTGQPLADPELSWTSNAVELRVGEAFTAPRLNNPYSVTGITYSSNNESLAKVDEATGAVTLVSDATGTATITAKFDGNDTYKAAVVSYTITVRPALVYGVWELVTDVNSLAAGDKVVIVAKDDEFALSTSQGNNNRGQAAVTKNNDNTVAFGNDVQVLTLEAGTVDNTFALNTGNGYLYASSTSANQLKTQKAKDANASWKITITDGTASIVAQGTNTRNTMQYNQSSSLFACYASASQKALCLYMKKNVKVEGETDNTSIPNQSDVTVDNAELTVTTEAEYDNMYIGNNGSVDVEETVTVNNLYIQTTMGTTTSGQLNTTSENLIVNGDVFIDITLGKNGDPNQWHAFTVPFPVDAMNGIFDLNDNKLTNGVNYAIMQYHGDVRAQGKYGWKKYSGVLVPGTFYLMTVDGARTTYRFKKVKDAALVAENTKSLSAYTGGGKNTDYGWNGVGNPTLMHGKVAFDAQILDPETYTYQVIEAASAHFTVGTPFFIQATGDGTMTMDAETSASLAPARRAAATVDKVKVMLGNADYTDYLYVSASEDATNEYEIGKDLAKMTMTSTPIVPQIFAHAYGTYLCMVNAPMISNEATVALNLYAPAEGEYTLSVEEQADATVYLLYNGNIVWNLSMSEYPIQLSQGDNAGYSLVVRRENAPTDVENIFGADEQTEKFIYNGNLYILHEGKVFDAVGNVLK